MASAMKSIIALALVFWTAQVHKYDPNGTWESESGSQYAMTLRGSDLHVQLVDGSNPKFLKYEVDLKNQDEPNTYKGTGTFVAKLESGKECKFETEWQLIVVAANRILGKTTNIVPDPETCAVKEKSEAGLDLKKK
jgi:hypothetical protein